MRYSTQQDVLDFVEDNNVKFVRFAFCDIFGTQKNIAVLASAVVLNTGTPDEAKFTAARLAGAAANRRGIPVVLDPVGVGASPWRLENIRQLFPSLGVIINGLMVLMYLVIYIIGTA